MTALAEQLAEELGARAGALGALLGFDMLGPDMADELPRRVEQHAETLATQLATPDDRLAAQTVIDIACVLWPDGTFAPPEWWHTPLGRAMARSMGPDDWSVTHTVAAAMLNVHRGTISKLVHRGTLARHPDGGVSRSAVMARLARLNRG